MRTTRSAGWLQAIAIIVCFALLGGCKKNVGGAAQAGYYIRFKLDGVQKEYTMAVIAAMPDTATLGWFSGEISGQTVNTPLSGISLNILSNEAWKINVTYEVAYQNSSYVYKDQPLISYSENGLTYGSAVHTFEPGYQSGKIRLTELTDLVAKGTFSGILLEDQSDPASVKYTVTDGEFYVPRIKTAGSTNNPGTGDGFIEFTLDGKTQRLEESSSSANIAVADFSDLTPGLGSYDCYIAASDPLATPGRSISFSFNDKVPFTTKEYQFLITAGTPIQHTLATILFTYSADYTKSYFYLPDPVTSEAILTLTKVETGKGGKVEGTFSMTNMVKYNSDGSVKLASNLNLTGGKFRVTTK